MNFVRTLMSCLLAVLVSLPALAAKPKLVDAPPPPALLEDMPASIQTADADPWRGQLLYEGHCLTCHESLAFVSERRLAKSLQELGAQVQRWALHQNLPWRGNEIEDVVRYLNMRHYHLNERR